MEPTVREAIREAGRGLGAPQLAIEAFLRLLRPCVHLCRYEDLPEETRRDARQVARAGGPPQLPEGMGPPGSYPHVLTIDCAAVPTGVLDIDFPTDGQLVVFADLEYGGGSVVHLPAGTETVEYRGWGDGSGAGAGAGAAKVHEPFPLFAVPAVTGPDDCTWSDVAETFVYAEEDAEWVRLVEEGEDELVATLSETLRGRWSDGIQLGGYSRPYQDGVEVTGHVLLLRIPQGAVGGGGLNLTLVSGTREQLAERRFDALGFVNEC